MRWDDERRRPMERAERAAREPGPWPARLAALLLSERGLGTLLTIVFVAAFLAGGYVVIVDMRTFQANMIAQAATTNEKLAQLQLTHLQITVQLDRVERLLLAQAGGRP